MKLLDTQAKIKANMGDKWEPYSCQMLPHGGDTYELAEVSGGIAPLYVKGKRKGRHNWDKIDKATIKTVYITIAENAEFGSSGCASLCACHLSRYSQAVIASTT